MKVREHSPLVRRLARAFGRLLFQWAENNGDSRTSHNVEGWLLRKLIARHSRTGRPFVVIDGGANVGDYTRLALSEASAAGCVAEVHVFEPSPHCLSILRTAFVGESVTVTGAALAAQDGEAPLFGGATGSSQASLTKRSLFHEEPADEVRVSKLRLGEYLTQNAISRVGLHKLDAEGSELAALQGLGDLLAPEIIDAIQFEYGGTTADAGINYSYANYVALAPRCRANGS